VSHTTNTLGQVVEGFNSIKEKMDVINTYIVSQNTTKDDVNTTTEESLVRSDVIKHSTNEQNYAISEAVQNITLIISVSQKNADTASEMFCLTRSIAMIGDKFKSDVDFFSGVKLHVLCDIFVLLLFN
jgi:methyl-accepting chemotaxis protein